MDAMSNSRNQKSAGMGLGERKKGKEKQLSELPPTGRSWPFKRSKSRNKSAEAVVEILPSDLAEEEEKAASTLQPSSTSSTTKASPELGPRPVQEESSHDVDERKKNKSNSDKRLSDEELAKFNPVTERERMLFRDWQEVKAKCVQMEKTMRWWSDCTANWREKWGRVRAERNKLKDELRIQTGKNEALTRELTFTKRELEDCITEKQAVRNDLNKCKLELKRLDKERRTAVVEPHVRWKVKNTHLFPLRLMFHGGRGI